VAVVAPRGLNPSDQYRADPDPVLKSQR